ncbi:glycosyltransferase [Bacillus cereus]|uniref:glycosyltransferase n=1 Tax=Bacillus cereus TaxID=1396 RepID=UPI000BF3ECC0|nr:glycosyltransferase family A protein [Bacillus cereus]PFI79772.1 hypothetical protein COI83_23115 [Bacillus cereus]
MISIICCTIRQNLMGDIFENYDKQDIEDKELIIVLNKDDIKEEIWELRASMSKNVYIYKLPEKNTLGECLNYGIQKAKHKLIAKFDDDDFYSKKYIRTSINFLNISKADIVGKRTTLIYFEQEHALVLHNPGKENKFVYQGIKKKK